MAESYFKKCFYAMLAISFFSNGIVVASITWLSGFFIAPEHRYLSGILDSDLTVILASRVLPFVIVMPLIFRVLYPGFRRDFVTRIEVSSELQRRVLQAPILTSLLASAGWVIGIFSFTGITYFRPEIPRQFIWDSTIFTWVLAAMALLVCYYALEYVNRRFVLTRISQNIGAAALKGTFNLSIRTRLILHLLATVGLPFIILSRIIFFLFENKPANFQYLGRFDIILLLLLICIVGILLTWIQSKFISAPLREMQAATDKIQTGDFETKVSVTSGDEIGTLAADINAMARGLSEREKMHSLLGRAVDPSVRDFLLSEKADEGELRLVSVLFCDLAGFTQFSEKSTPAEVVHFLNQYFALAQQIVSAEGGIINKFIGDAYMAVFNAPLPLRDHAGAAMQAAVSFRAKYGQLVRGSSAQYPDIRIGIHTGEVLAGKIGSDYRQEYTVIGDTVNTASRIESLGKKLGENLLLSEETVRSSTVAAGMQPRRLGSVLLRGKAERTVLYAL